MRAAPAVGHGLGADRSAAEESAATERRCASVSSLPCWRMTPDVSASRIASGVRSRSARRLVFAGSVAAWQRRAVVVEDLRAFGRLRESGRGYRERETKNRPRCPRPH